MKYTYITNRDDYLSYISNMKSNEVTQIALDLEGECNLHAYGEKLCLIQIYDGRNIIIIDPFYIDNFNLKMFFENRNILKIMYDSSWDLSLLRNNYEIEIKSILDLRPAVALLNYAKKDLHSIINLELGLSLEKKGKYQRYNWTRRPIKQQALQYAVKDVLYLFKLKDVLLRKLYEKNLIDEYILKNIQIQNQDKDKKPKEKYKNIKGYTSLNDDEKSIFKRVYDIRDKYAQRYNMPPHNIINNIDMIKIAQNAAYINEISFPKRLSTDSVQSILKELKNIN